MNLLLKEINFNTVLIVLAIVAIIAVIFAVLIVLVSKLCYVKEDEKVKNVLEQLSGANCGGCGYAGCADYAKALKEGKAKLSDCSATANENKLQIAKILDLDFNGEEPTVAVVKCAGGILSKDKFNYVGNEDCNANYALQNGNKVCKEGCLGGGTCSKACPHGGVEIKNGVANINKALCESCGVCVNACPKKLIELIPKSAKVYVACSTSCRGKEVINACEVGCIGCGLCAKNCVENAITMVNNLPVIDYNKCTGCKACVDKCPRKCIIEF